MKLSEQLSAIGSRLAARPILAAPLILAIGVLLGMFVRRDGRAPDTKSAAARPTHAAHGQDEATMWTCSMHPRIRSNKPGKCPICGMDLIPVAKTAAGGLRTLTLSPEARALMNVETAPVERRYVTHTIPMVGKVDYDETKLGYITAWVAGRLDRLYVDYTGVEVKKGDHMVYIYSEALYAAQEELIQALRYARQRPAETSRFGVGDVNLLESAREKLRLLGLNDEQIKEIESRSTPTDHLTIYSPVSGVVIDKLKQEGERVAVGERIYTIADLSQVWVHLDAYESDLPWIRYGQDVTITTEAYPGEEFHGRIAFIQPVLNDKTRTVKVRVNVPNPDGKLKPEMFVHATVRPTVAAGGRVMDPSLAGKWICPMHPEIVKDDAGSCDICGMALVKAESLGYVTPESDAQEPPLVIPYLAALVTGSRAIVYVELPSIHSAAEPALTTLSAVVADGNPDKIREAFATFGQMLEQPYDQPGTDYARRLWNQYADRLARLGLAGQRATTAEQAGDILAQIEATMKEARERFASPEHPAYEGREIVLGPRAGDYYLVRHGLEEGELVVTQGNFKIDAEIQIQAKPSMMTPEGGGAGGHEHAGHGATATTAASAEHASQPAALPTAFLEQLRRLEAAYERVAEEVRQESLDKAVEAFVQFREVLNQIDASSLADHSRMLWKEMAMLLGNDAVEGSDARQMAEADRVFLLLKGHMRRLREQFGVMPSQEKPPMHLPVTDEFKLGLADVWEQYLAVAEALATDSFEETGRFSAGLQTAVDTVDPKSLSKEAQQVWNEARASIGASLSKLQGAPDIGAMRTEFAALSKQLGALARTFGFGEAKPVYELHCPMAFQGKGAVWYQASDRVRNPYYGSAMLTCADRVEQIGRDQPRVQDEQPAGPAQHDIHKNHSQH
jgi:Cu(I)/Ag(I) efflux system membrane fusion protein